MEPLKFKIILIVFLPLLGAIIAGLLRKQIGKIGAHSVTAGLIGISACVAAEVFFGFFTNKYTPIDKTLYLWGKSGGVNLQVGFLVDQLTAIMLFVVTSISFMVHIYTVGYMHNDPGYQRFFSYISLFTFAMLMLVSANNFLQLFFGWEAVGLMSYLLIGFWYQRESANVASLKAFLVNRVGDFGFLLGIACVLMFFGSLDYKDVFKGVSAFAEGKHVINLITWKTMSLGGLNVENNINAIANAGNVIGNVSGAGSPSPLWLQSHFTVSVISLICISLFIGAMGKSAQIPLHIWLPDSMEGPTPISALIHAATMVTAGVFMVCRMSPLFEYSDAALGFVIVIGAITCFFTGILGVVQNDIKRIIAYSTLSQLGIMMVAAGASLYSIAIFHLLTHAFFKALLFLGAGSVIIAMHHEQDIRKMGNLKKYMPITYTTMLIGTLALIGFPGFSGFFSKDLIIEGVECSGLHCGSFVYFAVSASVFITSLYSFRLFFLVFHTKERMSQETKEHLHESPAVVWIPLVLLAIPSIIIGALLAKHMLEGYFKDSILILPKHHAVQHLYHEYQNAVDFIIHGFKSLPLFLAIGGFLTAWLSYVKYPQFPKALAKTFKPIYATLINKYWFDEFNQKVIIKFARNFGGYCWQFGDRLLIDGFINGTAHTIGKTARIIRKMQTGYLYHYAFAMIAGLFILGVWLLLF